MARATSPAGGAHHDPPDADSRARGGLWRPGTVGDAVIGAGPGRGHHLDGQGRGLRVRVLQARRHVRQAAARGGVSSLPRHRQARTAVRPDCHRLDRPAGQAGRDRRGLLPGRHHRRRLGRRPRSVGDARTGRGRTRVLHQSRRVRGAGCTGALRRRPGDRGRDLHPVQVPPGAERDRPADARLPHRARPAPRLRHLARHAPRGTPSAVTTSIEGAADRVRRAGDRLASGPARRQARPRPQGRCAQRRDPAAVRPVPGGAPPHGPPGDRRVGPGRRRVGPGQPAHPGDRIPRRVRGRRRHQRGNSQSRSLLRGPGLGSGLPDHLPAARHARRGHLRRARHVLPGVRPQPRRPGQRHLPQRPGSLR